MSSANAATRAAARRCSSLPTCHAIALMIAASSMDMIVMSNSNNMFVIAA
jgi:hypothetical protein